MLFQKYYEENIMIDWKEYYIDYGKLKEYINNIKNNKPDSEKFFSKELDKYWLNYYNFINQKITETVEIENVDKSILIDIFRINEFVTLNQECLRKIIKKHDKNSNYSLYPAWKWKIKSNTFQKLFPIIKKVSKLYPRDENISNVINNNSFKRKSMKFWVEKKNIIPVICHILPNLPVYIWDEDINDHIYQEISSVYFDNKELKTYNTRINKEENNKLIRIRWYGELPNKVFLERKVHHDDWTGLESSKDRILIETKNVMPFIRRNIRLNNELANEIQNCIYSDNLYPIIRTTYNRISFQLKNTNDIRISLDLKLNLIKEKLKGETDENCPICLESMKGRLIKKFGCSHSTCVSCFDSFSEFKTESKKISFSINGIEFSVDMLASNHGEISNKYHGIFSQKKKLINYTVKCPLCRTSIYNNNDETIMC